MAYDQDVAQRVRGALAAGGVKAVDRSMFGGLAFMVHGHMCVGVLGGELVVRVGPEDYEDALARPHTREMDFTGRAMRGWVVVAPPAVADGASLASWVGRGLDFVATLPPK